MHHPTTIVEASQVIGHLAGVPLHRWTEEGGTRAFEERPINITGASGTVYGVVVVVEVQP